MSVIIFNPSEFRVQFPNFICTPPLSDSTLQAYFDTATLYISNRYCSCWNNFTLAQRTLALYLMTAHIAAINVFISTGQTAGIMTSATVDKVSVTLEPPPAANQWQYWLQSTPYGQQLLALLQLKSAGGYYVTPYNPVLNAFRRY